jgi:protein TonB
MTAIESVQLAEGETVHHAYGWTFSLLCHALAFGCAIALMAEIDKPILPSTFQWEVAMIDTPVPVEALPPEKSFPDPVLRPALPPVKPVMPVQQVVQHNTLQSPTPVETVQAVQPVTQEITNTEPVLERPSLARESQAVSTQAVTSMDARVMEQVAREENDRPVVEQGELVSERSVLTHNVTVHQQTMMGQPIERPSPSASVVEHRAVEQRLVKYRQTQPDYGWLRETLWRRIEELKRYPALARSNHWEGRVVVEARISNTGEVIGLKIAESSGRAILDEEAMSVMKKASPLTLKHPLGASQVTILIPISYRLDG